MLNTRTAMIFVILSVGVLTVLTGTEFLQVIPISADKEECEENRDDNCNEQKQKIESENNCEIRNENENGDGSDENLNDDSVTGEINCWNFSQNSDDGHALVGDDINIVTKLIVTKKVQCSLEPCAFQADDFLILITGNIQPSINPFSGDEAGTELTVIPGSYSVTEPNLPAGVSAQFSNDCTGSISAGQTKNCLITNTVPSAPT